MPLALKIILLAIIQGFTEFFPVSSSGHLILFQKILGFSTMPLVFDIFFHIGTLLAVVVFFFRDLRELALRFYEKNNFHLLALLIAASLPTAVIGFLFKDFFESLFSDTSKLGFAFLFTAAALLASKYLRLRIRLPELASAMIIGVAQGIAIIPGVSRSGLTIAMALILGLGFGFSFRFSFLLSIPAILGAAAVKTKPLIAMVNSGTGVGIAELALGAVAAALSGYLAVRFMLWIIKEKSLRGFAWYVWALGILIISDQVVFHRFF